MVFGSAVLVRHFYIDFCHYFGYMSARISLVRTPSGGRPEGRASAVPAGGVTTRSRAALGISRPSL
jgi:hypothetical protein